MHPAKAARSAVVYRSLQAIDKVIIFEIRLDEKGMKIFRSGFSCGERLSCNKSS
jgi:hypothetical protein